MSNKFNNLLVIALFTLSCSPQKVLGVYESSMGFVHSKIILSEDNFFHYIKQGDTGTSEGYGNYLLEESKLILNFSDTLRSINPSLIEFAPLKDSIRIEIRNNNENMNLVHTISSLRKGSMKPNYYKELSLNLKPNQNALLFERKFEIDHEIFLTCEVATFETVSGKFDKPGKYVINHTFKKGYETLLTNRIMEFPIIEKSKDSIILSQYGKNVTYRRTN